MATSPEAADGWHYCSLLSPILALGVNVIAQVIIARARKGAQFLRSIVAGCVVGGVALVVFEWLLFAARGGASDAMVYSLLVNAPTYAALSFCYFAVANLGQTAIRVRLYAELRAAPEGMTAQEIERRYDTGTFMTVRLQRLLEGGDLMEQNGVYFLARKRLVFMANLMVLGKLVLFGKKSEFEQSR